MMFGNHAYIVGNVTRDPELRFAQNGTAICQFGLAVNDKRKDGEDVAHFFDVVAFRELAENAEESLTKGMRVVVVGQLQHRSWETDDGSKRSKVEILADEISPSLRWASAVVTKNDYKGGGRDGDPGPQPEGSGGARPQQQQRRKAQSATPEPEPF